MITQNYPPPLDKLLSLGRPDYFQWATYAGYGITTDHIPDLIRLATDMELNEGDPESAEVWGPLHAWRALGQLGAEAAIEHLIPLLHELEGDDYVVQDFPMVFALIGKAAISPLATYLADDSHGLFPRMVATEAIETVGGMNPGLELLCVAVLDNQLQQYEQNDPVLNGAIIGSIVALGGEEAIETINRAFVARRVDETIAGDWQYVRKMLGVGSPQDDEKTIHFNDPAEIEALFPLLPPLPTDFDEPRLSRSERAQHAKMKAKRKQAKKARKKNRK
jgi:hypothetical protein